MLTKEVVIIGAGPYGLSIAAHLENKGVDPYVIGKPMAFWKRNMPGKMLLRSRIEASNIAAPTNRLSIDAYQKAKKIKLPEPLPIEDFISYGDWFQKQVIPHLDERSVGHIAHKGNCFEINLDDGEPILSRQLVLAVGIGPFANRPEQFANIPRELAPHSSELSDLSPWIGEKVAVIGNGQSALEYAALLHEIGAEVEILTRAREIKFRPFAWRKHLFRRLTPGPLKGFSYRVLPPTDLGDISTARKMADPNLFLKQSPEDQEKLLKDCTKPVGAYWLTSRLEGIRVRTETIVEDAEVVGKKIKLKLNDGATELFDLVVLATGYKIDMSRYQILDGALSERIEKMSDGYPRLSTSLETSIPGLYMAGVVGEKALGPTLRFVTGTSNAGPRLASSVINRLSSSRN